MRDRLSWAIVLVVLFPVTLGFAWMFQQEKSNHQIAAAKADFWVKVIEQMTTGTVVTNADTGEIESWSHGAEVLLGWSAEEVEGRSVTLMLPADYRESHLQMIRNPDVRDRLKREVLSITCWAITKNGDRKQIAIQVRGFEDAYMGYRFVMTFDLSDRVVPIEMIDPPPEDEKPADLSNFPRLKG